MVNEANCRKRIKFLKTGQCQENSYCLLVYYSLFSLQLLKNRLLDYGFRAKIRHVYTLAIHKKY